MNNECCYTYNVNLFSFGIEYCRTELRFFVKYLL